MPVVFNWMGCGGMWHGWIVYHFELFIKTLNGWSWTRYETGLHILWFGTFGVKKHFFQTQFFHLVELLRSVKLIVEIYTVLLNLQNTTAPFCQPLCNRKHHCLHLESLEKAADGKNTFIPRPTLCIALMHQLTWITHVNNRVSKYTSNHTVKLLNCLFSGIHFPVALSDFLSIRSLI